MTFHAKKIAQNVMAFNQTTWYNGISQSVNMIKIATLK